MTKRGACTVLAFLVACGGRAATDEEPRARGVEPPAAPSAARRASSSPSDTPPSGVPRLEGPRGREDFRGSPESAPNHPIVLTERVETPAPAAPRDLARELRDALGDPAACAAGVDLSTANEHMELSVRVFVTSTGIVTRSSTTTSNAPEAVRACIAARAASVHLRGDIANAPREVATTLSLNRVALPPPAPNPETNTR